jgi:hypothetical protein
MGEIGEHTGRADGNETNTARFGRGGITGAWRENRHSDCEIRKPGSTKRVISTPDNGDKHGRYMVLLVLPTYVTSPILNINQSIHGGLFILPFVFWRSCTVGYAVDFGTRMIT